MDLDHLIDLSGDYVTELFKKKLNTSLSFHTIDHTRNVVSASHEIGIHAGLSQEEIQLLTISAWFHDTGYTMAYAGHEMESVKIARDFLIGNGLDTERIEKICSCVLATSFPQNPKSRIEMVLCDADFFHFSRTDYAEFESSLRIEWETILNRHYTNEQWNSINLAMLINHHYFTDFGRTVLQERKQHNILCIQRLLSSCNQSL